jgi:hypothetical protein
VNFRWPFGNKTKMAWDPPVGALGNEVYDLLRKRGFTSAAAASFATAGCVEANDGSDTIAVDKQSPVSGEVFFYVTRAENPCGVGTLGNGTLAVRVGANCP